VPSVEIDIKQESTVKFESIQIFTSPGKPRTSEGSKSQEYKESFSFLLRVTAVFYSTRVKPVGG
jgi:hypothetical protein